MDSPAFPPRPSAPTQFRPLAMSAPNNRSASAGARRTNDGATTVDGDARSRSPTRAATTVDDTQVARTLPDVFRSTGHVPLPDEGTRWLATDAPPSPAGGRQDPQWVTTAVAPEQLPDEGRATAVAPQQLSDEELARRHVALGVLAAQRGQDAPLHDVGTPVPGREGLPLHERRLRAWNRVARAADVRLRRALHETVASVDRLQFEVGAVPPCLANLDVRMEPILERLTLFADSWLHDAELIASHRAEWARELAALPPRPSTDSEPAPEPNAAGSSSGP